MKFTKTVPYKLKRIIPMLGIAGASLFMGGCEKEKPLRDVELHFNRDDFSTIVYQDRGEIFISELAKAYANDPTVGTIYLIPDGEWGTYVAISISDMRQTFLEPMFNYSPKFKGKGDFNFYPGAASKIPQDSLWFVSKGFTINKYRPLSDYQR